MAMHIGHVALRTPDLPRLKQFATSALGLVVTGEGQGEALLTSNEKHHELQLISGDRAGLDHIGLELEGESELEAACDRAAAAGGRILDRAAGEDGLGRSVRLVGPGDIVYELYVAMERSPLSAEAFLRPSVRRLGHFTFLAKDHVAILDFWREGLGFRISDRIDDLHWLRCDADHHGFGIAPHPAENILHHYAWEVQDVAALAQYCDRLPIEGKELLWGPARHGPGFNVATYLPDSDGCLIEVYSDMLRIYDEVAYQPIDWSEVSSPLNRWGPPPPDGFFAAGVPVLPA